MTTETSGASWSIVVPTIRRPSLWALLDSLRRSSHVTGIALPPIVVVDDRPGPRRDLDPPDSTRLAGVTVRHSGGRGPAAARNAGAARVTAEFVMFIDDDVRADDKLVEVHLSHVCSAGSARSDVVSCGPFVEPHDWSPTP